MPVDRVVVEGGSGGATPLRAPLTAIGLVDADGSCRLVPENPAGSRAASIGISLARTGQSITVGRAGPNAPDTITLGGSPSRVCMAFLLPRDHAAALSLRFDDATHPLAFDTSSPVGDARGEPSVDPPGDRAGQSPSPAAQSPRRGLPHSRLRFGFLGGMAQDKHDVATVAYSTNFGTSGTETLRAKFGGGLGGLLTYGYALVDAVELTASAGVQWAAIDKGSVTDASGGFFTSVWLLGPQINIPASRSFHPAGGESAINVTLTGGPSFYLGPSLNVDTSEIPGGSETELNYASATGWHVAGGVEMIGSDKGDFGSDVGVRVGYYSATYELESASDDGKSVPVSNIADEFQEVSGDAINLTLYLGVAF